MPSSIRAVAVIDLGNCSSPGGRHPAARFAQRNLEGQPLISRMVRRLSDSPLVSGLCVSGENLPATLLTAGIPGAVVLDLPHSHIVERLAAAADRVDADWVVYVPGNRPFIDPVLVDRLLSEAARASDCDYIGFFSSGGGWQRMQHLGLAGELCHADSLRRLRRNLDRLIACSDGLNLAAWFQDAPGSYQMRFIPVPAELDRSDLRFALESESDWDDAQLLCETLPRGDTQWQPLANIVLPNASLRESMGSRNV